MCKEAMVRKQLADFLREYARNVQPTGDPQKILCYLAQRIEDFED